MRPPHPTPQPPIDDDSVQSNKSNATSASDPGLALGFLERLWNYSSLEARCFSLVWIHPEKGTRYKFYCIDASVERPRFDRERKCWYVRDYMGLYTKIAGDLEKLLAGLASEGWHAYFQVLPLSRLPEKGRGSEKDVAVGRWLWADFDFKAVVEKPEFEGCREGEDHGLECYYREGDKWVHVKRPKLGDILGRVEELTGLRPSIVVDSGNGYHLYFRLSYEVDAKKLKQLETALLEVLKPLGADAKSRDLARILRLPGTINPRNGRPVRVIAESDKEYDPDELGRSLEEKRSKAAKEGRPTASAQPTASAWRRLGPAELGKVVEALRPGYIPGYRESVCLALGGWCARAGVHPVSCAQIVERLYRETGDTDSLETRLDAVVRSYKKLGRWGEDVEREFTEWVNSLGISRSIPALKHDVEVEEEVRGKRGLIETIAEALKAKGVSEEEARDKAIEIVNEAAKVLGWGRSIVVRTPYETGTWFVNDPKRGIVLLREKNSEDGSTKIHRKYISDWYIKRVLVVSGGTERVYKIVFKNARTREKEKPLPLSGSLSEIAKELANIHGIKRSNIVRDAVSAIVSELIRRGVAVVRRTGAASGLVPSKNGVKLVLNAVLSKLAVPKEADPGKARRALELLYKLREYYNTNKFDTVLSWAGYAGTGYALKKRYGAKQVYLLMHGERHTGKTTLARIVERMFPVLTALEDEVPEEAGSEYRLAHLMNITTAPVVVDEIQGISHKPALLGLLKRGSTGIVVRWRGDIGRRYHARAALILTSNYRELIEDPGIVERVITLEFTHEDYVFRKPREKLEEFKKIYNEYLAVAPHLGRVILDVLVERWREIEESWAHRLVGKLDYLELGRQVWRWVSEKLGVGEPEWCKSSISLEEVKPEEVEEEMILEVLHDVVRDSIARYKQFVVGSTLWDRLVELYRAGALPGWLHVRTNDIVLTEGLLEELKRRRGYTPVGGLRGLAERLGYKYMPVKIRGRTVKGMIIPARVLEFLETPEEKAEKLKEKYLAMFTVGMLALDDEENIVKVLVEKEGLSEEEAREVLPFLVQKLKDELTRAEESKQRV